jgi:DNA-binding LytR/AlgR family response regulator
MVGHRVKRKERTIVMQQTDNFSASVPRTPGPAPVEVTSVPTVPRAPSYWPRLALHRRHAAPPRVVSQHGDAWHFYDARRVSRFYAADKYTCFRMDGTEHLLTESLTALEARLRGYGFMRAHRSELVNLGHVKAVRRQEQAFELHLADGQRVLTSRRLTAELRRRLTF